MLIEILDTDADGTRCHAFTAHALEAAELLSNDVTFGGMIRNVVVSPAGDTLAVVVRCGPSVSRTITYADDRDVIRLLHLYAAALMRYAEDAETTAMLARLVIERTDPHFILPLDFHEG